MLICHIASLPNREESLRQCVGSIYPQVDSLYIMLNGYTEVPSFLRELCNVKYEMLDNSLGDAAKWLHINDESSISVILDDDLIVSQNFVNYMLCGLKKYGGAVSLHGKRYDNKPITSFRRNYTANYRCLGTVANDVKVHLLGTGCTLFDNSQVKLDNSVFEYKNMADVLFSRFCYTHNIPMTVLKHKTGELLRYIRPSYTIWSEGGNQIQTEILNSFLK